MSEENHNHDAKGKKMIALISHDSKKPLMIKFALKYQIFLNEYAGGLCATGTTGGKLISEAGLKNVKRFASGPLGGDQQIGAQLTSGHIAAIIFFRDPLTAHPHEPDVTALGRLCDVHNVPIATNPAAAEILIKHLASEFFGGEQSHHQHTDHSMDVAEDAKKHMEAFATATETLA